MFLIGDGVSITGSTGRLEFIARTCSQPVKLGAIPLSFLHLSTPASISTELNLRAVTPADDAFLRAVYASTRAEELATTPWSMEEKAAFCEMQFKAQDAHYRREYPATEFLIIERAGVPTGRLLIDRSDTFVHILDISLLPEHRNAGIGSYLLRALQDEAAGIGKSVTIYVEKFNPAQRLYARLGFKPVEDTGIYLRLDWQLP